MNDVTNQKLRQTLKQRGRSLTISRQAIFETFDGHAPLSMNQLIGLLPQMDRATIYRTVKIFEDFGILNRILLGWKYKLELSDDFSPHHHHLSCIGCGEITVLVEDPTLEKYIRQLSKKTDFQAIDHQLEIKGLCPKCQLLS